MNLTAIILCFPDFWSKQLNKTKRGALQPLTSSLRHSSLTSAILSSKEQVPVEKVSLVRIKPLAEPTTRAHAAPMLCNQLPYGVFRFSRDRKGKAYEYIPPVDLVQWLQQAGNSFPFAHLLVRTTCRVAEAASCLGLLTASGDRQQRRHLAAPQVRSGCWCAM